MHNFFSNTMVSGCDKVIVVGGFANSKYLINRLFNEFPSKTFFTPRQPHLAVVKGALYWFCQKRRKNTEYSFQPHIHGELYLETQLAKAQIKIDELHKENNILQYKYYTQTSTL
eukprot:103028_1